MQLLQHDKYYHIYNRGINGELLFKSDDNFDYFLKKYDYYISEVADTFAWCLMHNHFHFLVRIKDENEFLKTPSQQFSNLFNAYTKAYNKQQGRHGTLFERPFRRKEINEEAYFRNLVLYIHTNPVHHNIVENVEHYTWSSYNSIVSEKPSKIRRAKVIEWFDDKENFIATHQQKKASINLKIW